MVVAKAAEGIPVASPIGEDFHAQIEVDRSADEALDLLAGDASDLADARSFGPDENPLLTLPLDVQDRSDEDRGRGLPELLDLARDTVRDLVVELLERRFPDELRGEEAQRERAE